MKQLTQLEIAMDTKQNRSKVLPQHKRKFLTGLTDKYNRQISYLRVSVTDRCNFRCRHCMPAEGIPLLPREEILRYEEIMKVINTALRLGITNFRITGGEPLIRMGIIDFLHKLIRTPSVESVSLTTNGFLLNENCRSLKNIGLHSINIGLNSLNEDNFTKFTGVNGLQKVRLGIKSLLREGSQNIKINTVIIRGFNDTELLDFARLTFEYPISLRFIEYMPCGQWTNNSFGRTIPTEEIIAQLGVLGEFSPVNPVRKTSDTSYDRKNKLSIRKELSNGVNKRVGHGPAQYYQFNGAPGLIGFISPISRPFCSQCNRLRLTADGQLKSCLLSTEMIDLKPILSLTGSRKGRTNQKLEKAFIHAAELKPKTHCREKLTPMSRIGG